MNQADYELLHQLLRPLEGNVFDQKLLDKERLSDAVGHPNEDVRTASLYLMAHLMVVDESAVADILFRSVHDRNPVRVRTVAQFLAHSRFMSPALVLPLKSLLVEYLLDSRDEETVRLINSIQWEHR